ncbi:hypothetical protein N665_4810s0003 [Sinapis alba]|nr:hypothetical protein N665_4810s0003 [Sinapis alba]
MERKRDESVRECERSSGELQLDPYFGDLLIQMVDVISPIWYNPPLSEAHHPTSAESGNESFEIRQRVLSLNDLRRVRTVKYVGGVEGYSAACIGVDWDQDGDGKHNGSVDGVIYFNGRSQTSASFARSLNL